MSTSAPPLKTLSPSPTDQPGQEAPFVLSYFAQRRAAGYIGLALPPIVWLFDRITLKCVPGSISASYYTGARNFFVGSLCAVGIFLITSIGYKKDEVWSIVAGAMAFLVAFCPTAPDCLCGLPPSHEPFRHSHTIHTVAACCLFATFAVFCLFLFTQTTGQRSYKPRLKGLPRQKQKRNAVFIVCGSIMVAAMAIYAAWSGLEHFGVPAPHHLLLVVEWVCLWSFGAAWLVKGQQLFPDAAIPSHRGPIPMTAAAITPAQPQ